MRNAGAGTALVHIYYYSADGTLQTSQENQTVTTHAFYNLYTSPPTGLPNPFLGSVHISADRPITVSSNLLDYVSDYDTVSYTGVNR